MRTSESSKGEHHQVGNARVFDPWTGRGRPPWLPSPPGAAWATVGHDPDDDPDDDPEDDLDLDMAELPSLGGAGHAHHLYGRPRLQDRNPERVERAAFLKDARELTFDQVCAALRFGDPVLEGPRGRTRRAVRAGRESLQDRGVLPWAAFAAGKVPRDWPEHRDFWRAIRRWATAATLERARDVDRAPLARGRAYWRGVAQR